MLTERYKSALLFATKVHEGHVRKGSEIPYLSHLLSVSALVMENGGDEDQAIAGLLHDTIEDRGNGYVSMFHGAATRGRAALKQDIALLFGKEVLSIVESCTDDEYLPRGRATTKGSFAEWKRRKSDYLRRLAKKRHAGALRVSCADKLHNARAILADYETLGEKLWERLRAKTKVNQLWYYRNLSDVLTKRARSLKDVGLVRLAGQLAGVVAQIEAMG